MPCPAEVSVEPATLHTEKRLDSPRAFCTSPSSISDVDFSRSCNTDKQTSSSSDKTRSDAESGDEQEQAQDAPSRSSAKPTKRQTGSSTT